MNKINFQNLPNQTTPLNATNMNLLQDNVDNAKVEKDAEPMTSGDLNDVKTTKFVYATSSVSNKPASGNFYVMTIKRGNNNNHVLQIAKRNSSNVSEFETYERRYYEGSWTNWIFTSPIVTETNANGRAIKYPDGTMICTKTVTATEVAITTADGALYKSGGISLGSYAESFYEAPVLQVTLSRGSSQCFIYQIASVGKTSVGNMIVARPTSIASANVNAEVTAIGRWK